MPVKAEKIIELKDVDICASLPELVPVFPGGCIFDAAHRETDLGMITGYLCPKGDAPLVTVNSFSNAIRDQEAIRREGQGQSFNVPTIDGLKNFTCNLNVAHLTPHQTFSAARRELDTAKAASPAFSSHISAISDSSGAAFQAALAHFLNAEHIPFRRTTAAKGVDIWYSRDVAAQGMTDEEYIESFISLYFSGIDATTANELEKELKRMHAAIRADYPAGGSAMLQLIKIIASSGNQSLRLHRDERSEFSAVLSLINRGPEIFVGDPASNTLSLFLTPQGSWSFLFGARAAGKLPPIHGNDNRYAYHRSGWVTEDRLSLGLFYGDAAWTIPDACQAGRA